MGIKIKRKFFGIEHENYINVKDVKFVIENPFLEKRFSLWEFEFKIYLNEESRNYEKTCEEIRNKKLSAKTEKEQLEIDNFLCGHHPKQGVGDLGSIKIGINTNKLKEKKHHPLFYKATEKELYEIAYKIAHEGRGFFGTKYNKDIRDVKQDKNTVKKKLKEILILKGDSDGIDS